MPGEVQIPPTAGCDDAERSSDSYLLDSAISNRSELRYSSDAINPDGDTSQTIDWVRTNIFYDTGFHNSSGIGASYTNGLFAEVHEARTVPAGALLPGRLPGRKFGYPLAYGSNGVKYDTGMTQYCDQQRQPGCGSTSGSGQTIFALPSRNHQRNQAPSSLPGLRSL